MAFRRVTRQLLIDRDIARLLSQATYHRLVLAVREIVANSHDANASRIDITVDLNDAGRGSIEIVDDGDGMDEARFEKVFLSLGSTSKRLQAGSEPRRNRFGRRVIGQFGIGFIASVPFANEVVIETKSKDAAVVHGAKINCKEILAGSAAGTESSFELDGWDRPPGPTDSKSFTRVVLQGLTKQAYDSIDSTIVGGWYQFRRERKKGVNNELRAAFLADWAARILPLGYEGAEASKELKEILGSFLSSDYIPARITFNGRPLVRSLAEDVQLDKEFELKGSQTNWRARGVLWSPQEPIEPVFKRGVALRVGDMSIGEPGYLGLSTVGRVYGKLQHIAGEVHVEGLDTDLQLDRQEFYFTQATAEFLEQIRGKIVSFESRLQKKAHVMQKFRNLRKSVERQRKAVASEGRVAEILEAPRLIERLATEAKSAGIQVRRSEGGTIDVPKGERRVTIGANAAADILRVDVDGTTITVEVAENQKPMTTEDLADCILDASAKKLVLSGPHPLISHDEWALANVRWFLALGAAFRQRKVSRDQVKVILHKATEAFGGKP